MPSAFLPDRAFVRIAGPDAEHFLQNLITTDLGALADNELRPGALLTLARKLQTARCGTTTPLGLPVEPEV